MLWLIKLFQYLYKGLCLWPYTWPKLQYVAPSTNLVSPKVSYVWSEECQSSFKAKARLCCWLRHITCVVQAGCGCCFFSVCCPPPRKWIGHQSLNDLVRDQKQQLHDCTIKKAALALFSARQHFKMHIWSNLVSRTTISQDGSQGNSTLWGLSFHCHMPLFVIHFM